MAYLEEVIASATSTGAIAYFLGAIEPSDERTLPLPDLVSSERFAELQKLIVSRFSKDDESGKLTSDKDLGYILYRWLEWEDTGQAKKFVEKLIKETDGLLTFLTALVITTYHSGGGSSEPRETYRFNREGLLKFLDDLDGLTPRVQRIKNEKWQELDHEQQVAVDAFLNPKDGEGWP